MPFASINRIKGRNTRRSALTNNGEIVEFIGQEPCMVIDPKN